MSVLKNLRTLSTMQFYMTALDIRREITNWILCDFGYKKYPRNIVSVIRDISLEDQEQINDIYKKYGINVNKEYVSEFPEWYSSSEKKAFNGLCQSLIFDITHANSIYVTNMSEYEERRMYQTKAICTCYCLCAEIACIKNIFNIDLKLVNNLIALISDEIELLRAWRHSDKKNKPTK